MHVCKRSNIEIEDTLLMKSIFVPILIIAIVTLSWIIYSNSAEAVQSKSGTGAYWKHMINHPLIHMLMDSLV